MKIGVFDSGVGGLIILRAIRKRLSAYDYLYIGDTARVPYGNQTQAEIYQFTKRGVNYLFEHDCALIIIACNSASSRALRRLQREWLPKHYPNRKILGVIIPTVEIAAKQTNIKRIGILATKATTSSKSFAKEIKKLSKRIAVIHQSAPLLVPLIEAGKIKESKIVLEKYLKPLLEKQVQTIILGCTHYPFIKKFLPKNITIISQDEVIPGKLALYLKKHKEIEKRLTKKKSCIISVTQTTQHIQKLTIDWFGKGSRIKKVTI